VYIRPILKTRKYDSICFSQSNFYVIVLAFSVYIINKEIGRLKTSPSLRIIFEAEGNFTLIYEIHLFYLCPFQFKTDILKEKNIPYEVDRQGFIVLGPSRNMSHFKKKSHFYTWRLIILLLEKIRWKFRDVAFYFGIGRLCEDKEFFLKRAKISEALNSNLRRFEARRWLSSKFSIASNLGFEVEGNFNILLIKEKPL